MATHFTVFLESFTILSLIRVEYPTRHERECDHRQTEVDDRSVKGDFHSDVLKSVADVEHFLYSQGSGERARTLMRIDNSDAFARFLVERRNASSGIDSTRE